MASNPNSSFRQDSTKRHVFRLDTIYLNVRPIRARIYFRCDRIRSPFYGIDRHWSLRSLCLHSSNQLAIITCWHDMSYSNWWRLANLTTLLLASHQSLAHSQPNFRSRISYLMRYTNENILSRVYCCFYTLKVIKYFQQNP